MKEAPLKKNIDSRGCLLWDKNLKRDLPLMLSDLTFLKVWKNLWATENGLLLKNEKTRFRHRRLMLFEICFLKIKVIVLLGKLSKILQSKSSSNVMRTMIMWILKPLSREWSKRLFEKLIIIKKSRKLHQTHRRFKWEHRKIYQNFFNLMIKNQKKFW